MTFAEILNTPSENLVVISEVLDATFDTFADGPSVDAVLHNTELLKILKSLSHTIRSRVSQVFGNSLKNVLTAKCL